MRKKERFQHILKILYAHYEPRTELEYTNVLELLIATILSAQCTDVRVNIVTKTLFKKYKAPEDYLAVPQEELEKDIHSTGFYRNKAKNIRGACKLLIEEFDGQVPGTMEELLRLPGVARKTANCVLGSWFGKNIGVVVDTHVKRLSLRLGFTKHQDTKKIEQDLMKLVPKKEWSNLSHLLIWHGRKVCVSRKPRCLACPLSEYCPSKNDFVRQFWS